MYENSYLLDLDSGHPQQCSAPSCIANGGSRIAQGNGHYLLVFDLASNEEPIRLEHSKPVQAYTFSPDGRTLATWVNGEGIHLWNVATGEAITQFASPPGSMLKLRFSADGRKLCAVTVVSEKPDQRGAQEDHFYATVWQGDEHL